MVWYGMVEVCEGAPVAVSGWVLAVAIRGCTGVWTSQQEYHGHGAGKNECAAPWACERARLKVNILIDM